MKTMLRFQQGKAPPSQLCVGTGLLGSRGCTWTGQDTELPPGAAPQPPSLQQKTWGSEHSELAVSLLQVRGHSKGGEGWSASDTKSEKSSGRRKAVRSSREIDSPVPHRTQAARPATASARPPDPSPPASQWPRVRANSVPRRRLVSHAQWVGGPACWPSTSQPFPGLMTFTQWQKRPGPGFPSPHTRPCQ